MKIHYRGKRPGSLQRRFPYPPWAGDKSTRRCTSVSPTYGKCGKVAPEKGAVLKQLNVAGIGWLTRAKIKIAVLSFPTQGVVQTHPGNVGSSTQMGREMCDHGFSVAVGPLT
jgi:hypothetical protein